MSKTKIYRYKSGARLVYEHDSSYGYTIANIGFEVGASDETKSEFGTAHFLEHSMFLTSKHMNKFDKRSKLGNMATYVNGFTNSFKTVYVMQSLNQHFDNSADIFLRSISEPFFDKEEIEKEKGVVLSEMRGYESNRGRVLNYMISDALYENDVFHRTIGEEKVVEKMSKTKLEKFFAKYTPDKLVISGGGGISFKKFKDAVERNLGEFIFNRVKLEEKELKPKFTKKPKFVVKDFSGEQIQVELRQNIFDENDERRYALKFLDSVLDRSSGRLFRKVREERGLVYSISVNYNLFKQTGTLGFIFSCKKENVLQVLELIRNELIDIAENGITKEEYDKIFNFIKFGQAIEIKKLETRINRNLGDMFRHDKLRDEKEEINKLKKVTNDDIKNLAKYILENDSYVIGAVGQGVEEKDIKFYLNKNA